MDHLIVFPTIYQDPFKDHKSFIFYGFLDQHQTSLDDHDFKTVTLQPL